MPPPAQFQNLGAFVLLNVAVALSGNSLSCHGLGAMLPAGVNFARRFFSPATSVLASPSCQDAVSNSFETARRSPCKRLSSAYTGPNALSAAFCSSTHARMRSSHSVFVWAL